MVTAVYWVSEAVPLGAAALVPAFLYPLFGVLKSSEVSLQTMSPAQDGMQQVSTILYIWSGAIASNKLDLNLDTPMLKFLCLYGVFTKLLHKVRGTLFDII